MMPWEYCQWHKKQVPKDQSPVKDHIDTQWETNDLIYLMVL